MGQCGMVKPIITHVLQIFAKFRVLQWTEKKAAVSRAIYIYIYSYMIQGGNLKGRSIQYECSILTAID